MGQQKDKTVMLPTFAPGPPFEICSMGIKSGDRLIPSTTYVPLDPDLYKKASGSDADRALLQKKLEHIGYLFLENTRLQPAGTVIGEHVYTLSLAPQETVVLTQKSWTKRTQSFEEVVALEQEHSIERASAQSLELSETMGQEMERSKTFSLNFNVSGSYGPPKAGVNANLGINYGTTEAEKKTREQTSKHSQQLTEKAASRSRSEHKTTFKVETESGFESSSKRTIRNLNTCHSLMLNYYKVFQRFSITEERYDVRLCWSACVQNPGRFLDEIKDQSTLEKELAKIDSWIPGDFRPKPTNIEVRGTWVFYETPSGGVLTYTDDINCQVPIPQNFQLYSLSHEEQNQTTADCGVRAPTPAHPQPPQGTPSTPQLDVYWNVWVKGRVAGNNSLEVRSIAICAPTAESLDKWAKDLEARREAERQRIRDEWKKKTDRADDIEKNGKYDPLTELMRRVIIDELGNEQYDECRKVTRWHEVFDWEGTSYRLYPSWWGRWQDKKPSATVDFLNASWARLYIPIVPGRELDALELILGTTLNSKLNGKSIADDIASLRASSFKDGPAVLGQWLDIMPTDGTYVEPVLGKCEGCDDVLKEDIRIHQGQKNQPVPAPSPPAHDGDQ